MPWWLSVVTIVLGVLALLGPGAFVFWLIAPLWFAAVGIALDHRDEGEPDEVMGGARVATGLPH
jgi:hypothetical protein